VTVDDDAFLDELMRRDAEMDTGVNVMTCREEFMAAVRRERAARREDDWFFEELLRRDAELESGAVTPLTHEELMAAVREDLAAESGEVD
jgi:hypothetical protein